MRTASLSLPAPSSNVYDTAIEDFAGFEACDVTSRGQLTELLGEATLTCPFDACLLRVNVGGGDDDIRQA
jgi:hypothetical protein